MASRPAPPTGSFSSRTHMAMTTVLRVPLVAYGYLVERLRRLPVAGSVLRHTALVAGGLLAGAAVAFAVWAGTVAPQRVTLADLVVGNLSHMQTWIIVSGDLSAGAQRAVGYRYVLTDAALPNAIMNVVSDMELQVGRTIVSGSYTGGREPVPLVDLASGYRWIGMMRADAVPASENGPPWVSMGMLAAALLLLTAARVSYPMFFGQRPRPTGLRALTVPVGVRRGSLSTVGQVVPGTLVLQPGAPVELRVSDADPQRLRLHSARTGVEAGELRHLSGTEPALWVQPATGEMTLSFSSQDDRDAAYAALIADAEQGSQARVPGPAASTHAELL